nr:uncharacterized protein CI109_004934 [Kwoniella shandongensis]KAA5526731.1 hypothetical protein CI109_004934 [Kwoniella shandongensis]
MSLSSLVNPPPRSPPRRSRPSPSPPFERRPVPYVPPSFVSPPPLPPGFVLPPHIRSPEPPSRPLHSPIARENDPFLNYVPPPYNPPPQPYPATAEASGSSWSNRHESTPRSIDRSPAKASYDPVRHQSRERAPLPPGWEADGRDPFGSDEEQPQYRLSGEKKKQKPSQDTRRSFWKSLAKNESKYSRIVRPDDRLDGNEEFWGEGLKRYQKQREQEAEDVARWAEEYEPPAHTQKPLKKNGESSKKNGKEPQRARQADDSAPPSGDDENGKMGRPKGWPSDHPSRVAQREARDAARASGVDIPKRKYNRKSKGKGANIDDELLGLVGDDAASSPAPPHSDDIDPDETGSAQGDPFDPDAIVQPCGLTRAEVIARIEADDVKGLTEDDVKAVQDEMWMRKKDGGAPVNKDGTVRKKPGPAKGWKKMRGIEKRKGDPYEGSEAGDTSIAGDTVNGEADADIAALLEDGSVAEQPIERPPKKGKTKAKRRKIDDKQEETTKYADLSDEDHKPSDALIAEELDDDRSMRAGSIGGSSVIDPSSAPASKHKGKQGKAKEPGVGKGKWTRPSKPEKELLKKAEVLAVQQAHPDLPSELTDDLPPSVMSEMPFDNAPEVFNIGPNQHDPRGVSEQEAKVRMGLVEELQKQTWSAIVRDVPKIYRVYQGYDTIAKQGALRKAQAAVRNGTGQKNLKSAQRANKINKDAVNKAKRIVKEMLVYWKKNEKDELAARKKAEKEALERAKVEEEARESKRQARKLNFLLTQTELYSHFIGKKIKTHEAEDVEGGDAIKAPVAPEGAEHVNEDLGLDENGEPLPDIDYDDDDEENLRRHAARGAQAAVQAARDKAKEFDTNAKRGPQPVEDDTMDGEELNFQNPSLGADSVTITQPKMLMAQLKEYQLKGLTWLGNLYEQGINGILADEMGLGKTIQSISLLAYLAEHHNLWGPFLVIAPMSTLHNWQQELARFVPRLKALPYWGSPKDRETLRRIWSRKNQTFSEESPFHILVTSYQLAVQDEKYLQGMKWQYMILDEAQAIKSSSSARWKSLLSLRCRNRLLLTGTPIQNSMHELWALLHFIMPSLFDSHEEFSEWFSRDIENAAAGGNGGSLKPEQLRRLHMILKPFMLRRVKKHVQKELGDKIEIDLLVDLSQRQRRIYKALRQRVSISDLINQANNITDTSGAKNLMNLVMQFRKVCNHPDLFERADVVSPYMFGTFSQSGNLAREGDTLYLPDSAKNAIEVKVPRLLWIDGGKLDRPGEESLAGSDTHVLKNLMNIWTPAWINERVQEKEAEFGFVKLLDASPAGVARLATAHPLVSLLQDSEGARNRIEDGPIIDENHFAASSKKRFLIPPRVPNAAAPGQVPLRDITKRVWNESYLSRNDARFASDYAVAPLIKPVASNRSFLNAQDRLLSDPLVQTAMYGLPPSQLNEPIAVDSMKQLVPSVPPNGLLASAPADQAPISTLRVPPTKRLVVDSAKLARLDDLLRELKDGGHRVLLYFQMTKMMDLVEEYLIYRQYKYLRLDGSSPIGDRRDMVTSWQTNSEIFVFCLSTRAGGLGINLTAADTVIFYDHDWNPSSDAQAMDRAHRVGQTKQVTVYRLIARGTIEERILKMARAKKDVQDIVVGTKSLTDVAKPSEIVSLFMDDEELAESVAKRMQAQAHGYVPPAIEKKSKFGDGLGGGGEDDEDDFFSLARNVPNAEEEEEGGEEDVAGSAVNGVVASGEGGATQVNGKKKSGGSKRKGAPEGEKKPQKKKVKIALGPDGLPL